MGLPAVSNRQQVKILLTQFAAGGGDLTNERNISPTYNTFSRRHAFQGWLLTIRSMTVPCTYV
jgi:hypothetical protein